MNATTPTAAELNNHLSAGGVIRLSNPRWITIYKPQHAGMFFESKSGELRVKSGKKSITIAEPGIGLLLRVELGRFAAKAVTL